MIDSLPDLRTLSRPSPPAAVLGPWSRARRGDDGLMELQLAGPLPADWSLALCRGLAARGASLLRGHARRGEGETWLAELGIDDRRGQALGPEELCELAGRPPPPPTLPEPRILDYEIGDSRLHGGSLALEVDAWDAVGLLAGVLARVRAVGLSMREMILVTEEECAFHHLSLRGPQGGPPTRRQRRALALAMGGLLGG